jgi:hypothetical protein
MSLGEALRIVTTEELLRPSFGQGCPPDLDSLLARRIQLKGLALEVEYAERVRMANDMEQKRLAIGKEEQDDIAG